MDSPSHDSCGAGFRLRQADGASLYTEPWTWKEDSGNTVRLSAYRGQIVFLTMAYSSCRNTCAMTFRRLQQLQARLDRDGAVGQMVVVSYDPRNDVPSVWRSFRRRRGLERANWHFLTGDPQATRSLAAALEVGDFWSADRHIVHDFRIAMLDTQGHITRLLSWSD